jgi:hypothetical protein
VQMVPEMADDFPDGVPLLSLLSIPEAPVPEEAAHLKTPGDDSKFANPLEVQRCALPSVNHPIHHGCMHCAAL